MTRAQFALAVGADPKWIHNAEVVWGRKIPYTAVSARRWSLVRRIHEAVGIPLATANRLAEVALNRGLVQGLEDSAQFINSPGGDPAVGVAIDWPRCLSDFAVGLAHALAHEPRRRGRPGQRRGSARERAGAAGLDLSLLDASLQLTRAERLRRLDRNATFIGKLLHRAGPTSKAEG